MANVIQTLKQRGFVDRISDPDLQTIAGQRQLVVYCGFDPTADSLHAGNLVAVLTLAHFQRAGHLPIALVGGATGLIGDPSGKKDERTLMSLETVAHNVEGIKKVLAKFLSFEGENAARIVNNYDWMGKISFLDFIRDTGKHVRITEMLARESVKARLESGAGMSFTEFSYQLLQAYDFHYLHTHMGCDVQVGGSDQWGNITAGTDLIRRLGGDQAYGLVCPLLTTSSGQKFGKSVSGAIWLTPDRTGPYPFYQFWIQTEDRDVGRFLKLFTFLDIEEIAELEQLAEAHPEKREAQKRLAWEATSLVHGEEAARMAVKASEALFGGDLEGLDTSSLLEIFAEVPSFDIPAGILSNGCPLLDILVDSQLVGSRSEARRLIQAGGAYLNNRRIDELDRQVSRKDLLDGHLVVLRSGKKKYSLGKLASG
ncbi:MAG: tyrosine--tRNA ligase [Candidatus Omnitrophica bacterium]|nr:tyrosine--tRNA ligase [bacterium]MCL4735939.1 tyrosine--tRNA ligase [Candidatus Omnitrophota bacterium]